jgi:DNA-directed RNA polymerase specialized sigma24 family protein
MPRSKKNTNKAGAKKVCKKLSAEEQQLLADKQKIEQDHQNNLRCIKLINNIRKTKDEEEVNKAFEELLSMLLPKIQKVVSKFNIPGYEHSDILQEALYALRYKAIKDYDKARGTGDGPAPFDKFALLCIRRHLATEFKSCYQNKKRVLNQSVSIYKESYKNGNDDESVSLSNILSDPDALDICELTGENEYYKNLEDLLLSSLSGFEKEVYLLYKQKYSYEEITEKINNKRLKVRVNIKGVDNALSRIKHKAREILTKYEEKK